MDDHTTLRGINLGGWLVLEKWMTPSVFADTIAVDEYTYCYGAPAKQLQRLKQHRDTFITEADFAWIAQRGLQAVRLPVGYWSFGGIKPYQPCAEYIEQAFAWAAKHSLKVLLSVHGAPGSQNGQDHSGRSGPIEWHVTETHLEQTLAFVHELSDHYGDHPSLWGIELLNEPMPVIPKRYLKGYYQLAYDIVRTAAATGCRVVISDGFKPRRFKRVLKPALYPNSYIDTHQYQVFTDKHRDMDIAGHLSFTAGRVRKDLAKMARYHPVLVGEWSAALDERSLAGLSPVQRDIAYRAYASAQLSVYEQTAGWFYWSYKTEDEGPWSYRAAVAKGWLPASFGG